MTPTSHGVRAALILPVLVLIAATAACASAGPASSGSSNSSGSTPSGSAAATTPVATPAATVAAATQTFGGDCEKVLTIAAASTAIGATVELFDRVEWGPSDYASTSLGGLNCVWQGHKASAQQFIDLIILPAAVASDPSAKALDCDTTAGYSECYFNLVVSGYWFSGRDSGKAGTNLAGIKAKTAQLVAALTASAGTAVAPTAAPVVAGAWTKPTSCKALGTLAGVVAASGSPTLKPSALDSEPDNPDGYYAALKTSGYLGCAWATNGTVAAGKLDGFTVELAGGGAFAKPFAITSDFTPVTVPGADAAYVQKDGTGIDYLEVFKGSNWAAFEPYGNGMTLAQATPIATAVLSALG